MLDEPLNFIDCQLLIGRASNIIGHKLRQTSFFFGAITFELHRRERPIVNDERVVTVFV